MMFSNSYILPGNRWKGLGMSIPAWGKKGFIPGGRIPGDVRKGRPAAARPKGLPKFNAAAAAAEDVGVREAGLVTTGEVGRERGEDDWTNLGEWPEGDKICGDGVSSRLIGECP